MNERLRLNRRSLLKNQMKFGVIMMHDAEKLQGGYPMERNYTIAGIRFRIRCPEEWMYRDEGVLAAYGSDDIEPDHTLNFSVVEELSAPEGECVHTQSDICVYRVGSSQIRYVGTGGDDLSCMYMRIYRTGNRSEVQVKRKSILGHITSKVVLNALEAEHHIVMRGGFLLHASYICYNGRAILFTAPSGTGKSTQAELWCQMKGARLLNGDRAAVMREGTGVVVRGIPFAGSSGVFENESYPLAAIVYLSQAPETQIVRLSGVQAFRRVWEGCSVNTWNSKDVTACSETVLNVVQEIPVFHLACTPDETAVEALNKELIIRG
jgi:hypothetical protein